MSGYVFLTSFCKFWNSVTVNFTPETPIWVFWAKNKSYACLVAVIFFLTFSISESKSLTGFTAPEKANLFNLEVSCNLS